MDSQATVSQEDTSQTSGEEGNPLVSFLEDIIRRRKRRRSQLAKDIGVSHPTVLRWLSGEDIPSILSCRKLAAYSGLHVGKVLAIAGHLPALAQTGPDEWPEFHEYMRGKYPAVDEDLVSAFEDYIERRTGR